jgi:hypothetical protein
MPDEHHARGRAVCAADKPGLRARWCIAFVGLLVFYGGGQRSQVYAQLQEPVDLNVAQRRWATDKRVTLAALLEKHPRQMGYSKVSFPSRTRTIFEFHLGVVKPALRGGPVCWPDGDVAAGGMAARAL